MNTQAADATTIVPPTRQERAIALIEEAVNGWRDIHHPGLDLSEQVRMMAGRVNSWIAPRSVEAGVGDIMAAVQSDQSKPSRAQIEQLGTEVAKILHEHGLLAALPRKAGLLAT